MIKQPRKIFLPILVAAYMIFSFGSCGADLASFKHRSASVLPVYYNKKRIKWAILSRETAGRDKKTYDDFGGKKDRGEDQPLFTAAREFFEEAIIEDTIGLSLSEITDYIDTTQDNTEYVVVYSAPTSKGARNVTYITDFSPYRKEFLANFYEARKNATNGHYREKDRIAVVQWDVLRDAIINQPDKDAPVKIIAYVIDPITNDMCKKEITLRVFLIKKLRLFFLDDANKNEKIRFYSYANKD